MHLHGFIVLAAGWSVVLKHPLFMMSGEDGLQKLQWTGMKIQYLAVFLFSIPTQILEMRHPPTVTLHPIYLFIYLHCFVAASS